LLSVILYSTRSNKTNLKIYINVRYRRSKQPVLFLPLRPRFRLERLRKQNAFLAIQKPLESMEPTRYNSYKEQIDTAISKIIKDLVIVKSVDPFTGDNKDVVGEFVEPIHLQIVCQRWWREEQKLSTGYENFSSKVPSVDESLKELYESTIREAVSDKISEGMIRNWCDTKLITPSGTRGFVHLTHQLAENEIDSRVIDIFEKEHLIRSEWRSGALWYELTHDRLIQPIKKSNEKWQQQQHQKEVANSIAESNAKIRHYKKIMYVSISVCAVILIGVVIHLNPPHNPSNSCVVGVSPIAVNFSPNGDTVYVANKGSNSISVIGKDCKTVQDIKVGEDPVGVAVNPSSNIIYVPNSGENTVSVINGTTNTSMKTVKVGLNPHDVAVNPKTDRVYVANTGSNTVSVIDGKTNDILRNVPVGDDPTFIAVNPSMNKVYVTNSGNKTVSVIDGKTNDIVANVRVGDSPSGVAVDSITGKVYVANYMRLGHNSISSFCQFSLII
jgi:YVTN family beta-propeller protein